MILLYPISKDDNILGLRLIKLINLIKPVDPISLWLKSITIFFVALFNLLRIVSSLKQSIYIYYKLTFLILL